MYFFFLAFVFTLPSSSFGLEAGRKTIPVSMTSLMDFMLWMGIMDDGWRTTRGARALIAVRQPFYGKLVVEETHMGECHGDAILVAGVDDMVVADATASLCDKLYTAAMGTLDVVAKGEERVRAQCHVGHLIQPCTFLFLGKYRRFNLNGFLPHTVCQHIHVLVTDVNVNGVIAVSTLDAVHKLQVQHLGSLA